MKWLLIIMLYHGGTSTVWMDDLSSCQRSADYINGPMMNHFQGSGVAGCVQATPASTPLAVVNVQPTKTIEHATDHVKVDVNLIQKGQ
jgi:putative alpha-1,2-mannosidase